MRGLFRNLPRGALLLSVLAAVAFTAWRAGEARAGSDEALVPPVAPLRAVQIINTESDTLPDLAKKFDEYKAGGAKAVIFRVFHNPGDGFYKFIEPRADAGVYFQTKACPVVADALGPVIELAHKRGLLLIAWMTSRYASYGHDDETKLRCMAWDLGKKEAAPSRGYCPILPEVQVRLAQIYLDLAAYPIDGVLIQDDLILKHTEGMNPAARELYEQETGRKADPDLFYKNVHQTGGRWAVGEYTDEFRDWCRWKNKKLIGTAERLRQAVHKRRPHIPVGMNIYYEVVTKPENGLMWFSQDISATMESSLDFYSLMMYQRQMAREMNLSRQQVSDLIVKSVAGLAERAEFKQRIWVKLQCVDWDSSARVPPDELGDLVSRLKKIGPLGIVIVPAPESLNRDALKRIFM